MSVDHEALLRAAGIQSLPPGVSALEVVQKICRDHLVRDRVFDLLVEQYAAEALTNRFHFREKEPLRVRTGAEIAKLKFRVEWSFIEPSLSQNGQALISAKAYVEGDTSPAETFWWSPRTLEEARQIRFRGEACPGDILWRIGEYLGNPDAALFAAQARDRALYDANEAQKKAGRLTGELAVAIAAQQAK